MERALNIIMKKRTIVTPGTKCYILQYYGILAYYVLVITGLVVSQLKINKNVLGELILPYLPLNTALIKHMADVPSATAPHA